MIAFDSTRKSNSKTVCDGLERLLWMREYLDRHPTLSLEDARNRWGVALRTFRRDIARMRHAGFIIDPAPTSTSINPAVTLQGWYAG